MVKGYFGAPTCFAGGWQKCFKTPAAQQREGSGQGKKASSKRKTPKISSSECVRVSAKGRWWRGGVFVIVKV
jgi:hypothetical protein